MPSGSDPLAYDILGVPRGATQDEVKKRYRELARQLHPDVNQNNPSASRQFAQVTQAYKTLSDPDTRRVYDAELTLREQKAQTAARQATNTASAANNAAANRPRPANNPGADSARITGEARAAFLRDRPVEARTLAEQAIRLNRRNADAWEVLGDVFRRQGRSEEAVNAYSMSLQINPRNPSVMQRLERMAKAAGPGTPLSPSSRPTDNGAARGGGSASRGASPSSPYGAAAHSGYRPAANTAAGRVQRMQDPDKRPLARLLFSVIGYGSVAMLVLYAALYHGEAPLNYAPLFTWVSTWNGTVTTILALCGLILGATMTVTGAIRRIDDELILSGVNGRAGTFLPLGLLMIVVSVLNFYVAAALYAIVTALQESFTASMVRVFSAVFIVTALLAAIYTPGHWQVLLFGGNVVFITFIVGWLLGDFFRPDIG